MAFALLFVLFMLLLSCRKNDSPVVAEHLSVTLNGQEMRNDLYYSLGRNQLFLALKFSQPVDSATIPGNISLSDRNGLLDTCFRTLCSGRKVILEFQTGFRFRESWRYTITVKPGVRSTSGLTLVTNTAIEIRTPALTVSAGNDTTRRDAILCISDIHMGDQRAAANGYCWFSKNADALESLLDMVQTGNQVRQLVILGDLFDEWVIPYRMAPFDTAAGIRTSRDYFISIAASPVNAGIISKLKAIAASGTTQLVYIPGNHDMLLTKDILEEIIPGTIWQGDSTGLGHYSPMDEIIMEHGHRFDFFNCPQPLVNPGHMLPPGYFISRLQAEGLYEKAANGLKEQSDHAGSLEFLAAWTTAYEYLVVDYSMTVAPDSVNIRMGGIDSYSAPFSFNGVRDMFAANIEDRWTATQTRNMVPVSLPVLAAILDGNSDLCAAATVEYLSATSPRICKIAAFGHTHNAMIKVTPPGKNYTGIYANTGTWVNAELTSHPVRTFLVIWPGRWTGSDLDVVSLYQYNLDSGSGSPDPGYIPVLLSEESIINGE
jgi:UDP-2,3-diacylglucosamine pyrophosphatase LpxH